jgi:hypothetical protein
MSHYRDPYQKGPIFSIIVVGLIILCELAIIYLIIFE